MTKASRRLALGLGAALLGAIGCGGDDDGPDATVIAGDPDGAVSPPDAATPDAPVPDAAIPDATPPPDRDPHLPDAEFCPTEPCDLVDQCGCDEGEACDVDVGSVGATECRMVTAPGDELAECMEMTDCAAGYICVDKGLRSNCKKYCRDDSQCTAPGGRCVLDINLGGTPVPGANVCTNNCNLVTREGCPENWGCNPGFIDPDMSLPDMVTGDEVAFTDCDLGGLLGQGASCTTTAACLPGYTCAGVPAGGRQCLRYCVRPAGAECEGEEFCYGVSPPIRVGDVDYGVCLDMTP